MKGWVIVPLTAWPRIFLQGRLCNSRWIAELVTRSPYSDFDTLSRSFGAALPRPETSFAIEQLVAL